MKKLLLLSLLLLSATPLMENRAAARDGKPLAPTPGTLQHNVPNASVTYGVVGQGNTLDPLNPALLQSETQSGVHFHLIELTWSDLQPGGPSDWAVGSATAIQGRINAMIAADPGAQFYLDLGLQYPPAWVAAVNPLVDQFGHTWSATIPNGGGANLYWSPTVRAHVQNYLQKVFTAFDFQNRVWTVRLGPMGGELLYPEQQNGTSGQSFWAYDATAQAQSPVPGWRPGQPSPNGEARTFYYWYVDNLTATFNFLLHEIRRYYAGYVAPVTPGGGMWETAVDQLVSRNLVDPTLQHYGTGNFWHRMFPAMGPGANILHWCSSVGDGFGNDADPYWWGWTSTKQIAWMAHQLGRPVYAENLGRTPYDTSGGANPGTTMQWIFGALRDNNYAGVMWVREADMQNPAYANLAQYGAMITQAGGGGCSATFSDVPADSTYYAVISDLVARGAISGYGDCTFRPGSSITRGQVAKVLVVGLGLPLANPPAARFTDVPVGSPFFPYVETAYARGIIAGYADNTFRPGNSVTRGQLAKMVASGRGWTLATPGTPTFTDVPATSAFFPFIETAYQHHVLSGYDCGTGCLQFRAGNTATRGQGSKIVDLALTAP